MPRLSPSFPSPYTIEPTPAQYDEGVRYAKEILLRARNLCKELDLPISELKVVATYVYDQVGIVVRGHELAEGHKRFRAISQLRRQRLASIPVGRPAPAPNLGHYGHGTMTADVLLDDDGLEDLSTEELNKQLVDAGLDKI